MSPHPDTINRRDFLKTSLGIAAASSVARYGYAQEAPHSSTARRPNILFLFGEQHHPGVLSPAGHPFVQTPHLERMVREGVYFRNAYCPTPLCVPCRTSTLTGRYSHSTGIPTNLYDDLIGDQPNMARNLRSAGYHTCHIGKTHLATGPLSPERWDRLGFSEEFATSGKGGAAFPDADGHYATYLREKGIFELFSRDYAARQKMRGITLCDAHPSVLNVEDYHDEWISRTAINFIRDYHRDQPFFLAVNWAGPHAFRDAPGKYASMYDPDKMDPPINDPMELAPTSIRKRQTSTLEKLQDNCWKELRASYYGMISLIDDGIGRILKTLEAQGILENTIVIYSADHGEMLCDHGMVYKTLMYESSAAVPFIVRYPKAFRQNHRPNSLANLIDLAPTLLEMAGAESLPVAHGRSLVPELSGKSDERNTTFSEFQKTRMVREGSWKYIEDPNWDVQQLFNLDEDPDELNNLVQKAPHVARELSDTIKEWLKATSS